MFIIFDVIEEYSRVKLQYITQSRKYTDHNSFFKDIFSQDIKINIFVNLKLIFFSTLRIN